MHSKERVSIRSSVQQVLLVLTLECLSASNALDDRRTSHLCCRKPLWSLQTLFVPGISYLHPLERHLWRKRWLRRWVWRKSWSVLWRWEQKTIVSRLFLIFALVLIIYFYSWLSFVLAVAQLWDMFTHPISFSLPPSLTFSFCSYSFLFAASSSSFLTPT